MNTEAIAERVKEIKGKGGKGPLELEISPTTACNLHCLYCSTPTKPRMSELEPDKLRSLIKEGCENGASEVRLHGEGEPFARKELTLSLMELAKKYKVYGTSITNGTLFEEGDLKRLVAMGWDELVVSLDTHDEETQDELRGALGAHRRIVATLRAIKGLKEAAGAIKPSVKLNTVISRLNFRQLHGLVHLAHELGIDSIYFDSLIAHKEWMNSLKLDDEDHAEFLAIASLLRGTLLSKQINTNLHGFIINKATVHHNRSMCFKPWYSAVILPNGGVKPCCNFPGEVDSVHGRSLMDVWRGRAFKGLRKSVLSGEGLPCYKFCPSHMQENNKQLGEISFGKS